MDDLFRDELLTLAAAASLLPTRPHVSTLWRWCRRGVKGVRLQTVIVGGRRYTKASFLSDFVAQLTDPRADMPRPESPSRDQQKVRAAELAAAKY
jgi:hypothetical protein